MTAGAEQSNFDRTGPLVFGGGGARTVVVCGYFGFAHELIHPIVASLPALIHVKGSPERRYAWLEQMIAYMEGESKAQSEAWGEIVRRVAEILFIHVLRAYMGTHPHSTGALMALADPHIGRALQAVHRQPSADWTVDSLAQRAAMSKTVFAERFRTALGMTPARYVTLWRMQKARALLDRTERSIREIAWEVGYESEAAFNRVFREHFGVPPGRYRRTLDAQPSSPENGA